MSYSLGRVGDIATIQILPFTIEILREGEGGPSNNF
jgi:hypothetical protein